MAKRDPLKKYRSKRDTQKSTEPYGGKIQKHQHPIFVIQKHAASHLHYDLRLAIDGVLKSWAVPKGPSLNPRIKRLATPTEDHPYEYASFEGTIPEGNYGAGTVMIWDYGTYHNIKQEHGISMSQAYKNGKIEILLQGKRLQGMFALVRMHNNDDWLLIKMNDDYASAQKNPANTIKSSAKSGKTMAQIAGKTSKKKKQKSDDPSLRVGKQTVAITNPDKPLFKNPTITKQALIEYYHAVAPFMLPYLKDRPISMQRFPEGIAHEGFYQKDAGDYFPAFITTKKIKKEDGSTDYVIVNNAATLVYLANLACITVHPWLSTTKKLHYPNRMIFDLDPSTNNFGAVRNAALVLKELLDSLGLQSFPLLTGSRGIHVWVPIKPEFSFEEVKDFSYRIAQQFLQKDPDNLTLELRKEKRQGKIFIDYLRNAFGQTGVAPYAVRPKKGAPVATPITWQEVAKKRFKPDQFTIHTILKRLAQKGDVWGEHARKEQSLKKAFKKLDTLIGEK